MSMRGEHVGKLHLAQFAAAQVHHLLAQHRLNVEKREKAVAQSALGNRIEKIGNLGNIILLSLVPAHLVAIVKVGSSVSVAEGDVFYILVSVVRRRGAKIIFETTLAQKIFSGEHLHEQALTRSVGANNGNMLSAKKIDRGGCIQAHKGVARHRFA